MVADISLMQIGLLEEQIAQENVEDHYHSSIEYYERYFEVNIDFGNRYPINLQLTLMILTLVDDLHQSVDS